jgi:predicted nucleotidyltransferase
MKNLNDLQDPFPEHVLFSCVAGSRAYGTNTSESDEDIRGLYAVPECERLKVKTDLPQTCDTTRANRLLSDVTRQWESRT